MAEENTTPTPTDSKAAAPAPAESGGAMKMLVGFLGLSTIGLLAATIVLAVKDDGDSSSAEVDRLNAEIAAMEVEMATKDMFLTAGPPDATNPCAGSKPTDPAFKNTDCIVEGIVKVGGQAAGNVTKGYKGMLPTDVVPITKPYWQVGLCPVNVHWHLGAEHLSVGEYDTDGKGPDFKAADGVESGSDLQCHHYDANDEKFTKEYDWKYCKDMQVGQTYEVHWPHSAAGACGTVNQYQTPFYDGVFCNLDLETFGTLTAQDIASAVGVQAQVFTIVNDESYYWPDLMRGMIVEGEYGADIAKYTGSTTGQSRNNDDSCSAYSPITWQVDRKCHMISASTFDKMCADMLSQRDDMSKDVTPSGSRVVVADELMNDNQQDRKNLRRQ